MAVPHDLRDERDALAFLGLLARAALAWDVPLPGDSERESTHTVGFNIHALVIDNDDGEVLALGRNTIHGTEDPMMHAECAAIGVAVQRLRNKRPRDPHMTVATYHRNRLFYEPGNVDEDYARKGCILYTTLEPCPMCTGTICACHVKRTVFLIPDKRYGGSWGSEANPGIKGQFYPSYDMRYERFEARGASRVGILAGELWLDVASRIDVLRSDGVLDTRFLDHLRNDLERALCLLSELEIDHLVAPDTNGRTLRELKRVCASG